MLWPSLIAGFILGFAGSLHCVGMCGPLSMALPTYHLSMAGKFISLLLYQLGRITTYSILGLVFGLAGRTIYIAGIQQWFSVTLGILVLIMAGLYFVQKRGTHISFFTNFYLAIQNLIGKILKTNTGPSGFFVLGMANGLLPCGMVYIALATTLSLPQVYQGIGFMALFGAGTLPAMMIAGYGAQMIKPSLRIRFRRLVPIFIMATGIILILRGLNLGITFISPQWQPIGPHTITCHP